MPAEAREVAVTGFRACGQASAARLDLLGVTEDTVRATLATELTRPRASAQEKQAAELHGSHALPEGRADLGVKTVDDGDEGRVGSWNSQEQAGLLGDRYVTRPALELEQAGRVLSRLPLSPGIISRLVMLATSEAICDRPSPKR